MKPVLFALLMAAGCTPVIVTGPDMTRLPTEMQGRWGLTALDCEGGATAKGLMVVSGTQLRFYESVATLVHVVEHEPGRVLADYAFTGEGRTWSRQVALSLRDGGVRLARQDIGDGIRQPWVYTSCG